MIRNILFVALGGATGSALRYLIPKWLDVNSSWGTLIVNVLGSLLIGILIGLVQKGVLTTEMKLLLVTGFCGGFTTFSTFANEAFSMLKVGDILLMALYTGASVVLGVLAVHIGLWISGLTE